MKDARTKFYKEDKGVLLIVTAQLKVFLLIVTYFNLLL